jgi:hypothetical protein
MIKKALPIVAMLSCVLLTGCYSLETGNPTRESEQVLDEMLGNWDVKDTFIETDNTSEIPIVPILQTYKIWQIEYSDHRGKERSFFLNNKGEERVPLYELNKNMERILKNEMRKVLPDFDIKHLGLRDPYYLGYNLNDINDEDFYKKHKKIYNVKDFKLTDYFKDNTAYIEINHDCGHLAGTSSEETRIQCKKEVDEFVQKIPHFNGVITVFSNEFVDYFYLQGKEVPVESLETQKGESTLEKYESLVRESFPDLKIS